MPKKNLFAIGVSAINMLFAVCFIVAYRPLTYNLARSDDSPYTLLLNSNKRIYSETSFNQTQEVSGIITTTIGNELTLNSYNIVKNNNGWQTLLPNGYIYNPVLDNATNNKISGLKSISFVGSGSLKLHYGYSLNNEEIIYSFEHTLSPNVEYTFDDNASYFYLNNENSSNVDINSLSIKYSCNAEDYPRNNLNVLMIGNSFADDTVFYSRRVAESYGITLNIYDAYIAGCTIEMHYNNLNSNATSYSMRSTNGTSWVYDDNKSLSDIINFQDWDIITFQQASAQIGHEESYENLSALVAQVRSMVGAHPKFYWHETWAYDHDYMEYYDYFSCFNNNQDTMFDAIIDCYQSEVKPLNIFEKLIPAGTAVQNMRTTYMGDNITRDGKHMSQVHGRYLLSLNFISTVLGIDLDMSPCGYLPEDATESYKALCYESIRNARKEPLSVSQSIYTNWEMDNYDLTNYTEIDAGLVGNSYYNSMDPSDYANRFGHIDGTSDKYVSSARFTPSTLPIGSLVFLKEGYGYRPEAWFGDYASPSRPNETYQNVLEVDSSFWSNYAYRAFNIFKAGKGELANQVNQFNQIFDNFHIFVPNNLLGDIKTKTQNDHASEDRLTFIENFTKFDSYERIHLDPIMGFYKCDETYEIKNKYIDSTAKRFVCTKPFYTADGDLPENTVIICDEGYQWRSDCWGDHGKGGPRPEPVTSTFTKLDASFMDDYRARTFNVAKNDGVTQIGQNATETMDHVRIYVPINNDTDMPDKSGYLSFVALGYVEVTLTAQTVLNSSTASVLVALTGDSNTSVSVKVMGSDAEATDYVYNKSTHELIIHTEGEKEVTVGLIHKTLTYGTLTGTYNPDTGEYSNISIDGSFEEYLKNNGEITCSSIYRDKCSYKTDAMANAVWQRWYMGNDGWVATETGITTSYEHTLENPFVLKLEMENNTNIKTRLTLKQDLNNGAGLDINGLAIWIYNPNGAIYKVMKMFTYTTASTVEGDHVRPGSTYGQPFGIDNYDYLTNDGWTLAQTGYSGNKVYNISFYFECYSSETTYLYIGGVTLF